MPASRDPHAVWIEFGSIARAHGVRGELRLVASHPSADLPDTITVLRLRLRSGKEQEHKLAHVRSTNGAFLVTLDGVSDRDVAQGLAGARVLVSAAELPPLGEGEVYLFELQGARAVDQAGAELGVILALTDNGAQDLLVISSPSGQERLLPLLADTLVSFDREGRKVTLLVPEGLWET